MTVTKIATCCYCGSHAALSLMGGQRHELACATCGAPVSRLKQLPLARAVPDKRPELRSFGRTTASAADPRARKKTRKVKKGKSLARKAFSELWDVVEDIFD